MAVDSRLRLLIGGVTLVAGSAFAQTPNPTPTPTVPPDSVPGQIAPGANPTLELIDLRADSRRVIGARPISQEARTRKRR